MLNPYDVTLTCIMLVLAKACLCCLTGAHSQAAALALDKQSLQAQLNQHLESSHSSSSAMHAELSSLRDRASKTEAALTEAHSKVGLTPQQLFHKR